MASGGVQQPNGCISSMPAALLLCLWLVSWGLGTSLQLLQQFYTLSVVFRIPHSSSSPAMSAEGGAT
jgi:hypothetical protein